MGEQVRVSPKCGEKLKWGFESPTAPKKKCLTNRKVCAIIPVESEAKVMTILFGIVGIGLICSVALFVGSFFI